MWRIGILSLLAVVAIAGLKMVPPTPFLQESRASPSVLRVCWGCTYGSIQAAIDAAQPGDIIEVEPFVFAPVIQLPPFIDRKLIISKPITLRAQPYKYVLEEHASPSVLIAAGEGFDIEAESGQVVIEGFDFLNTGLVWNGGADLVLKRNRFLNTSPYTGLEIDLFGEGQAYLIENEIVDSSISIFEANWVLLKANKLTRSDINIISGKQIKLEQNLIEGGEISIGGSGSYLLEENILLGGLRPDGKKESGLLISGPPAGQIYFTTIVANRNLIARYQRGVALGINCDEIRWLRLSGQGNVIEQNDQDLCPDYYPWPPGFRK